VAGTFTSRTLRLGFSGRVPSALCLLVRSFRIALAEVLEPVDKFTAKEVGDESERNRPHISVTDTLIGKAVSALDSRDETTVKSELVSIAEKALRRILEGSLSPNQRLKK